MPKTNITFVIAGEGEYTKTYDGPYPPAPPSPGVVRLERERGKIQDLMIDHVRLAYLAGADIAYRVECRDLANFADDEAIPSAELDNSLDKDET